MTEPQILISSYLHGVLTEGQKTELSDWIKQDREHQRIFARETYVHRCLYDLLVGNDTQEQIFTTEPDTSETGNPTLEKLSSNTNNFDEPQTHPAHPTIDLCTNHR